MVQVGSVPGVVEQVGGKRYVRGNGVPHPWGNPFIGHERELELRRAMLLKALEALTTTPDHFTLFWPNYGNQVGAITSMANPAIREFSA